MYRLLLRCFHVIRLFSKVLTADGEDYSGRMEMIAIPARVMTRLITISITDDNLVECVERFIVTITSVTTCGVTISNNMSEVIITDDDSKNYTIDVSVILENIIDHQEQQCH